MTNEHSTDRLALWGGRFAGGLTGPRRTVEVDTLRLRTSTV